MFYTVLKMRLKTAYKLTLLHLQQNTQHYETWIKEKIFFRVGAFSRVNISRVAQLFQFSMSCNYRDLATVGEELKLISSNYEPDMQFWATRQLPPGKIVPWLGLRLGLGLVLGFGGKFSSGAIVLEPQFWHISFSFNLTRNINFLHLG